MEPELLTSLENNKAQAIAVEPLFASKEVKMGRPSIYTNELANKLCFLLAEGKSLRTVCKLEGMPDMSTVFDWLRSKPDFSLQYARAKQESADAMAEEVLDIADEGSNDWMEKNYGKETSWVVNGEAVQRSKLRVDTRKWLMAKMKPKKYGEAIDVTSGGEAIKGNTIVFQSFAQPNKIVSVEPIEQVKLEEPNEADSK